MPEITTIFTADESQLVAAMQRGAAAADKLDKKLQGVGGGSGKNAAESLRMEMEVLRLQASGNAKAADSLREYVSLRQQAVKHARDANVSEAEAMRLLQERAILQKQIVQNAAAQSQRAGAIANPRQTGLPGLELTPASLASLEKASARAQDLSRKTLIAGQSGKNGALGFLAFSQAVEDAQYGIKGVLNNIPQMVLGFGGGAGIAGVLSLAAVAAYGAWQAFQRLSGIDAMTAWAEKSTAATEKFTAALRKNREQTEALNRAAAAANDLQDRSTRAEGGIDRAVGVDQAAYRAIDAAAAATARARAAEDALRAAGGGLAPTDETATQQGQREWQAASIRYATDQKRLTQDLATSQETLNKVGRDYARIWANIAEKANEFRVARGQAATAQEDARLRIGDRQAELERARAMEASAPAGGKAQFTREIADIETRLAKETEIFTLRQREVELYDRLIQKTTQEGKASLQFLDAKKAALIEQIALTKDAQRARENLAQIEAAKIGLGALQKQRPVLEEASQRAIDGAKSVQAIADEIELMDEALAQGGRKLTLLDQELAIRQKIQDLVQKGVPLNDASLLIRGEAARREAIQKALASSTGTITERREARSAERDQARREARDQRVADAAAKRAEQIAKREAERERRFPGEKKDEGIAAKEKIDQAARDAREKAAQAEKDLQKNQQEQLKTIQNIERRLEKITAA